MQTTNYLRAGRGHRDDEISSINAFKASDVKWRLTIVFTSNNIECFLLEPPRYNVIPGIFFPSWPRRTSTRPQCPLCPTKDLFLPFSLTNHVNFDSFSANLRTNTPGSSVNLHKSHAGLIIYVRSSGWSWLTRIAEETRLPWCTMAK